MGRDLLYTFTHHDLKKSAENLPDARIVDLGKVPIKKRFPDGMVLEIRREGEGKRTIEVMVKGACPEGAIRILLISAETGKILIKKDINSDDLCSFDILESSPFRIYLQKGETVEDVT